MRESDIFPSPWLKAEDIPQGRTVAVTIAGVTLERVGQDQASRAVLSFVGKQKRLPLNRTNFRALKTAHGDNTETWAGKPVEIICTTTEYAGKIVPCLRLRVPQGASAQDAFAPPPPPPQAPAPRREPDDPRTMGGGFGSDLDDAIPF